MAGSQTTMQMLATMVNHHVAAASHGPGPNGSISDARRCRALSYLGFQPKLPCHSSVSRRGKNKEIFTHASPASQLGHQPVMSSADICARICSHGVAVLTMSKPWQLYLLPSEWSSVKERNETLKLLVPNDRPPSPTSLGLHKLPVCNQRSRPVSFFRSPSSSTKVSQPKRPKTLPDPINLAYPSRRPMQGGTRHGERRVPSQRTDPRARPPP